MTQQTNVIHQDGDVIEVPLNKLKKSPRNARRTPHAEADIEALAASIAVKGVLQAPVVGPETDEAGAPTGFYLVTIGEGRRLALVLRAKRKQIRKSEPVRCVVDLNNDPHEISLDENVTRFRMHPADEFEAFREQSERRGLGAEEIGARFGVSAQVVKQRLRLGAVSPRLMERYRAGDLTLDQMMAYAVSEDHAVDQRAAAEGPPSDMEPELPGPPTFRDLATVRQEIQAAVRVIKVPAVLTGPHPIVARLLRQDAERKPSPSVSAYFADRHGPKFASLIQQRRLRILSCILTELDRLGCKASGSTHAGERFSISVGGAWTYILFGIEGGASESYFHRDGRRFKAPKGEGLRFDLVEHDDRTPPKRIWREDETPLERQATDIVLGLLFQAEDDTRKWALMRHQWDREDRVRRDREAKLAAGKAEAERIAREEAAAAARIASLIDGGKALERAARIRRYVDAVRAANAARLEPVSGEALEKWATWALAEADTIDPVASGRFLSDLEP